MLYRIKNVSSKNLILFLTQGALTLSQACEDETALTKLTDGWRGGLIKKIYDDWYDGDGNGDYGDG